MKVAGIKATSAAPAIPARMVEISAAADRIGEIWDTLLLDGNVKPIGLGARDLLRLEAGLCLYGHDIDTTTSPIEAALNWSIRSAAARRASPAPRVQRELAEGVSRIRVGLAGRPRPAREGTEIATPEGEVIGVATSGGFGPTLNGFLRHGLRRQGPFRAGHAAQPDRARQALLAASGDDALRAERLQALNPFQTTDARRKPWPRPVTARTTEYIRIEGDVGTVGISDYAQSQLGDVVFVELPTVGQGADQGGEAAVVESVKAASEVYAPVRRGRRGQWRASKRRPAPSTRIRPARAGS
jgi:hypothetical protein